MNKKNSVNPTVAAKKPTKLDLDWVAFICHIFHFVFVYAQCYNCPRKCMICNILYCNDGAN